MIETTDRMRVIELERQQPMREILAGLCDAGYSIAQMAADLKVDDFTVRRWLKRFSAQRRYVIPGQ